MKMTMAKARTLDRPGMYRAATTLYLRVVPGGSKQWVQRLTIHGRQCDLGLGGFPLVTLQEAKDMAWENRRIARRGGDPLAQRREAQIRLQLPTFRQAAMLTHEALRPQWRSATTADIWMKQLERHGFKRLARIRVDRVTQRDVLGVLKPLWVATPETGRRLRRIIKQVFTWAMAQGYMAENPAGAGIDGALPRMPAVKKHLRAMPYQDVGEALRTVEGATASLAAKLALRLVVLTACRTGEVLGARWDEFDREARVWVIPPDRMKAGKEHRVPLTAAVEKVLEQAEQLNDGSGLVFPSPVRPGNPLSNMALTKVLRDNGLAERTTVHGFRSAFRDWAADTSKPREVAEASLAHFVGAVEGAYMRTDLLKRRFRLMGQWEAYLLSRERRVVALYGG